MNKRIIIVGGTGLLGKPVANRLQTEGYQVRVLARDIQKAQTLLDPEIEIVSGDATKRADLEHALQDCWGVHISLSGDAELIAVQQISQLAPEISLKRISYISGCTVKEENRWFPMIDTKLKAEALLQQSGLAFSIFAPTYPMEMLERYARNGKPLMIGKGTNSFHFFALEDLAFMVSKAMNLESAANQRFIIHGPEAIPFREALIRYCHVFHPEVQKVSSMPVWIVRLLARLMGNDLMKFGADLADYFDKVGEMGDPTQANQLLGAPSTILDQWLSERNTIQNQQ